MSRETMQDIQVNLYALASRHPDYRTRAWAWAELRQMWNGPKGRRFDAC